MKKQKDKRGKGKKKGWAAFENKINGQVEGKKKGLQRLILDARPVNRLFAAPPGISLTGEGLGRLEIDLEGDDALQQSLSQLRIALGVADVSDYFHRLRFADEPPMQELK